MSQNPFRLDGRVAIITGASKGIGASIAQTFAANGAKVVVSSRKQAAVDEVVAEIQAAGGEALAVAAHVGDTQALENLVKLSVEHYGRIDILVNNAATNPVFGPLEDSVDAMDKIMQINVKAPLELAKFALPYLKAQSNSAIINISSVEAFIATEGLGCYSVSKAALNMLTKSMAKEWGKYGIRANAICPGLIKTKFSEALWSNEAMLKYYLKQTPLGRIGEPQEIANLALFLASDASTYSTGAMFMADGGILQ
ncbi:MAG: SDR family oxidoreductase [Haliscomenobacter sp.]|uniref:SDR family NAD(P)-dependent oxidoreductase n=1 Tax=Haliscomenobacter sp. TaxID=2717303 RepID=UPI0029B9223E|nr:SDR family oxidoreductase [Haliscomenobacter sp.]MDX2072270.1 SDR family oxidoreductase [Haliscomenobacter sp.]